MIDALANSVDKPLPNDSVSNSDALLSRDVSKGPAETINISTNGRIRLNAFDSEQYVAFTEDYQNQVVTYIPIQ